ncbi:DUF1748 domain-containing protein [Aspergillus lucknowensis]|uniref:DUF1748-domain-containing protein n=1 Tax=Aspergillus lucknowensis TaxID=176173 RepID=A0ABR4LH35_9EURO
MLWIAERPPSPATLVTNAQHPLGSCEAARESCSARTFGCGGGPTEYDERLIDLSFSRFVSPNKLLTGLDPSHIGSILLLWRGHRFEPSLSFDPTRPLDLNMFGRITHYAFDAVLISAFLAGVKRSTGLT